MASLSIMINRSQAISIMEAREAYGKPLPFSLTFVSLNTGQIKSFNNVILAKNKKDLPKHVKGASSAIHKRKDSPELLKFYLIDTGEIRSLHFQLITAINNLDITP